MVCPAVKRVEGVKFSAGTSTSCYSIRYSGWKEIKSRDLFIANFDSDFELALTPVFVNRMRVCTVLSCAALVILGFGCMFALVGNCSNDNKTLVASGLFIFGGLLLGTGLMVFASVLSEIYLEVTQYGKESINGGPKYDYKYGWCFFIAIMAFILTKLAAVCSLTGYLNRFASIDEMVRLMVPGAERKMREHQRTLDYLDKQSLHHAQARLHGNHHPHNRSTASYDALSTTDDDFVQQQQHLLHQHSRRVDHEQHQHSNIHSKTPPDLCTSNKCQSDSDSVNIALEGSYDNNLAGQTIPITIKSQQAQNHVIQPPLQYANKYGTLPTNQTMFQGYLDVGQTTSYNKHARAGGGSATLQSNKKKCVKIETFQADTTPKSGAAAAGGGGFCEFSSGTVSKKSNLLAYSGSAV